MPSKPKPPQRLYRDLYWLACVVCARHFPSGRRDAIYCSGACKQAAYRVRRRRAKLRNVRR